MHTCFCIRACVHVYASVCDIQSWDQSLAASAAESI